MPRALRAASPQAAARRAVAGIFALNGLLYGSWAARVPAIRDRVGVSDGELGLILAAIALGAIVAMPAAGGRAARRGSATTTRATLLALCAVQAVVALPASAWLLGVAALAYGAAGGALDVSMNAHGVAVERAMGRPILSSLHAAFSAGGLAGAGIGAIAAGAGLDVRVQFAVLAGFAAVLGVGLGRRLLGDEVDAGGREAGRLAWPSRALWLLGLLAFAGMEIEGATGDWSAVYLRDDLGAGAGVAALGFTAFSVAMTLVRLAGDRLVTKVGDVATVRIGAIVGGVSLAAALLIARPVAAIVACIGLGVGVAVVVPIAYRMAGVAGGSAPGRALGAVSSMGYAGFLVGPPLVGGLAQLTSLPTALGWLVVLAAAMVVVAGHAAPGVRG